MCLALRMALAAATFSMLCWANPVRAADSPKPLFAGDEVLSLTLTGPIETMSRDPGAKPVPACSRLAARHQKRCP